MMGSVGCVNRLPIARSYEESTLMGAFATLTIPLNLSGTGAEFHAWEAANAAAGSQHIIADRGRNELRLEHQFPGNITALMRRLGAKFALPRTITASVPVRSLGIPDHPADVSHMLAAINSEPGVSGARIEGDRLVAEVPPITRGLYVIFNHLLHAGLIAQDVPTLVALRGL